MNPRTIAYKIYDPASGRRKERPIMAKYSKRIELIATSKNLVKEIEEIILNALENKSYSDALTDINVAVRHAFGCRVFPRTSHYADETFFQFIREFGSVCLLVGALVEYDDDYEEIKKRGL